MNVGEFAWKHASPNKGAVSAVLHGLKYLVLPLLLVMAGLAALSRGDDPDTFRSIMLEMQFLVLVFGLVLTVLGFFRGAYPKGSYSRLTFGMSVAVLTIAYVFSLLLGGRLQEAIAQELFDLDLELLFVLYFISAIFTIFMQLGEFVDHRRRWLEGSEQTVVREKEDPQQHRWYHDFRMRYGSLYNGLKLARGSLLGFIVIPLAVIIVLKAAFSSLDQQEVDELMSGLDTITLFMLGLGLPITILSFPKGFYPKGSFSRLLPALVIVLLSMYWIWVLGMEGRFVVDTIEGFSLSLDYSTLLLLIVLATSLWIVHYVLELFLYRPEWRNGGFPKDVDGKYKGKAKDVVSLEPEAPAVESKGGAP